MTLKNVAFGNVAFAVEGKSPVAILETSFRSPEKFSRVQMQRCAVLAIFPKRKFGVPASNVFLVAKKIHWIPFQRSLNEAV